VAPAQSKFQIIDEPRAAEFGGRECDQWLARRRFAQIAAPPDGHVVRLPTSCAQGVQRVALEGAPLRAAGAGCTILKNFSITVHTPLKNPGRDCPSRMPASAGGGCTVVSRACAPLERCGACLNTQTGS
jgi:hypothetical protein